MRPISTGAMRRRDERAVCESPRCSRTRSAARQRVADGSPGQPSERRPLKSAARLRRWRRRRPASAARSPAPARQARRRAAFADCRGAGHPARRGSWAIGLRPALVTASSPSPARTRRTPIATISPGTWPMHAPRLDEVARIRTQPQRLVLLLGLGREVHVGGDGLDQVAQAAADVARTASADGHRRSVRGDAYANRFVSCWP